MASDRVVKILQSGYRKIRDLLEADRVYVALYDARRGYLEFPLVEPQDARGGAEPAWWNERPLRVPELPVNNGAQVLSPDWVIAKGKTVLCDPVTPAEFEAGRLAYWPGEPLPCAWLSVPLLAEDQILGALVVENRRQPGVLGSKEGLLTTVARNLAIAVANARLREQQDRQIARLTALYDMGQRLTASIQLSEQKIIELIYEQASRVMDTKNMYIALYDEATDTVRFALAYRDDRRVDVEKEEGWQPRSGGQGRTEEIIRTRKPIFTEMRAESQAWYREEGRKDYIKQPFVSWVGVPMLAGEKVLGVIATYHAEREYAYDEDDVRTLTMLASQVAVAIENAQLYQKLKRAQGEIADKERDLVTTSLAMDLVHRMNNLAGPIPPWVTLVRRALDPHSRDNPKVTRYLDQIVKDASSILQQAQELRSPLAEPEAIDMEELLGSIVGQLALLATPEVEVVFEYEPQLPPVHAVKRQLGTALYSVVENAVRAILPHQGRITIELHRDIEKTGGNRLIRVDISDTGSGISPDRFEEIFEYGSTHWPDGRGTGYGLWRARNIIRGVGGSIRVSSSTLGQGTTFTILLPSAGTNPTSMEELIQEGTNE